MLVYGDYECFVMEMLYVCVLCVSILVIGPNTKADNAAASVQAFPWMGPKSTTSFILIVRSFTCRPNRRF